jgi:DNA-binding HxlR family transcriptional regulator
VSLRGAKLVSISYWIQLLSKQVSYCNHIAQGQTTDLTVLIQKVNTMVADPSSQGSECPVARTLEAIGDRWSLMIIRDAFDGIRRFSEFQKSLGVAKNILASRLKTLVEVGVFDIQPASDGSAYKEYVLTEKGREIFPVVVSMRQWGERFLFTRDETRSVLLDNEHGQSLMPIEVRSLSGQKLGPSDCHRVRVVADES